MPQNFLNKKVLFTLITTRQLSKVATLQMYAKNKFAITPEQYLILSILAESGELYQRQICEITYKDRPNMTRLLNILEKDGLVKRISEANGRKINKIRLTEKGAKMHAKIKPYMLELRDDAVKDIKKEELETCFAIMNKMMANLEKKTKLHI